MSFSHIWFGFAIWICWISYIFFFFLNRFLNQIKNRRSLFCISLSYVYITFYLRFSYKLFFWQMSVLTWQSRQQLKHQTYDFVSNFHRWRELCVRESMPSFKSVSIKIRKSFQINKKDRILFAAGRRFTNTYWHLFILFFLFRGSFAYHFGIKL